MNAKTLKALKGSVAKWIKVRYFGGENGGVSDCPLCDIFMGPCLVNGCIIAMKTGKGGCNGTPYELFVVKGSGGDGGRASTPTAKRYATLEINFLTSLIPQGKCLDELDAIKSKDVPRLKEIMERWHV